MKKTYLALSLLAVSALTAASTYRITLYSPAKLSGTELKPGDYKLELRDGAIVLKQGKLTIEAPVTVQTGDQKFELTTVSQSEDAISEIRLGGTATKIIFRNPAGEMATAGH